jgi:hypothetical protein
VDVNAWYEGELGELVRQIVPSSDVVNQYFSKDVIQKLLVSPTDRRYQVLLWQLLGFHFWHRIFIDSERPDKAQLEVNSLLA